MKKSPPPSLPAFSARLLAALLAVTLAASSGWAQLSGPAQSTQFNRIGYTIGIAQCYSASAAAQLGGDANFQVTMLNACAGANVVQQNSGTGTYWRILGFHQSAQDPNGLSGSGTLSAVAGYADDASFAASLGAGLVNYCATYTDVSGIAYQPGNLSTVGATYGAWYIVYAHEVGHNFGCNHADGLGNGFRTVMLHNYCGGYDIDYYSNPSVYYNGIQLLGSIAGDCGTGGLAHNGNNAGIIALAAAGIQQSQSAAASTNNLYNPLLTAVHCGGAAVATLSADQRTFAADQAYSGGSTWNANGYGYAIDVSGVNNPAPQTVYQEQRSGNLSYTFTGFLPGTNYLVRLHCDEVYWTAPGQRVFNVFINGQKVLTNFDIFATAGAINKAVIKEIRAAASVAGNLVIGFSNVTDNASISAIEILQGGLYVPLNLRTRGATQPVLNWQAVTGATAYKIKRGFASGGPYTTIGSSVTTNFTDNPPAWPSPYYYVVSALNGGDESFNSLETTWRAAQTNTFNFSPTALGINTGPNNPANGTVTIYGANLTAGDVLLLDLIAANTTGTTGDNWAAINLNQSGFEGVTGAALGVLLRTGTGANTCQIYTNGVAGAAFPGTTEAHTNRLRLTLYVATTGSTTNLGWRAQIDQGLTGTFKTPLTGTNLTFAGNSITLTFSAYQASELITPYQPATNSTPPTLYWQPTGRQLQFAWPPANLGWRLLMQTNSLTTSNWTAAPGSDLNIQYTIPVTTTNPAVFFRLVYP